MLASWIADFGKTVYHVIKTLQHPVQKPTWGKTEVSNQQPAPTCQLCESMWKQILKLQVNLQVTVAVDDILTVIS